MDCANLAITRVYKQVKECFRKSQVYRISENRFIAVVTSGEHGLRNSVFQNTGAVVLNGCAEFDKKCDHEVEDTLTRAETQLQLTGYGTTNV